MQFFYHQNAGEATLKLDDIAHFKARRYKVLDKVCFVNFVDFMLYEYEITSFDKKNIIFTLLDSKNLPKNETIKENIIALCVIDIKEIFEILPFLNEINTNKLLLVYGDFSQKNYKLDDKFMQKANKILINSSEQCGRYGIMQIEVFKSLKDLLKEYKDIVLVDFNGTEDIKSGGVYLVGPEGGFSPKERSLGLKTARLNQTNILKAKTATCFIASKIF